VKTGLGLVGRRTAWLQVGVVHDCPSVILGRALAAIASLLAPGSVELSRGPATEGGRPWHPAKPEMCAVISMYMYLYIYHLAASILWARIRDLLCPWPRRTALWAGRRNAKRRALFGCPHSWSEEHARVPLSPAHHTHHTTRTPTLQQSKEVAQRRIP
jgi:hypothetical protein